MPQDCPFCLIVNRELPATVRFENDDWLAINDIHPKAPVHMLLLSKRHVVSLIDIGAEDMEWVQTLPMVLSQVARENELRSYKIVINNGRDAGQIIDHFHVHVLSGKVSDIP